MRAHVNKNKKKVEEVKEMNSITYIFEDGSRVVQPINKEAFFNEKGKKRSEEEMLKLFNDIAFDKRAKSFSIDSEEISESVIEREVHFTRKDCKNARRDYKEFVKRNFAKFHQERADLRNYIFDNLPKRIKFNLAQIQFSNL